MSQQPSTDGRSARSSRPRRGRRVGAVVAGGAVLALALTACSSSSSSSGSSGGGAGEVSAAAKTALAQAYKGVGADLANLPSVTPKAGVNFYVISCGQSVSSCSAPTAAMQQAATAAGWSAHMADGKLSPSGFAAAIRQAIAGGAKVIVPIGFDCQAAQAAFKEAVDAGITVVGGGGPDDCRPGLWKSERLWLKGYTGIQEWNTFGKYGADWAYGQNNGKVKAITLTATTNSWGPWITDGFKTEMTKLGGSIETNINVTDPETADGSFVQKVTTALLAHPDVNVLQVPVGGWLNAGLYQAIQSSGRKNLTVVVGGQSDATTLALVRGGTRNGMKLGATPQAQAWGAWGSVDTAIRVLAGQQPVHIGEQIQAVDATHNLPKTGAYQGTVQWKSAFLTSWGKG
ncbi:ABC-type sugar transport system, substrate-binding protein, contains N-terminal xre family HTH domain [Jatrophihabitans endophyticus]|uniref:ABC-type sugar transport system, substrate-binding protein, contains N-terminal xre family HTH domain n=1 Tax=Jatrophihabitans endophyticus TaxID=1206085 RepID=A0A1M5RQN8_9ACTN|nr:substrate-binding domain-containing protein [Jatrophihabitans endophyticus]SHH28441.1 ABC-type sugar transport system, substrate-binding protein, contains N-terminal xre family HTH domain [Jatrophihabitans endophyticus]